MMKYLHRLLLLLAMVVPVTAIPVSEKPRNLLVTVLQTTDVNEVLSLLALEPEAVHTGTGRLPPTVYGSRRYPDINSSRQLQVLEGRQAYVEIGQSEPEVQFLWVEADTDYLLPNVSLANRQQFNGFTVTAELAGDLVILQLQHYHETSLVTQELATTVSGRIGQWLDLGGSLVVGDTPAGTTTYSVAGGRSGQMRVLVKVELAE